MSKAKMPNERRKHIQEALSILGDVGMPRGQRNERSAICLLALLNLTPDKAWAQVTGPLIGITPIMDWARQHYRKNYAPNSRETVRRQTIHQFVQAGIARYNPDEPGRAVNSPNAVYQIAPECGELLRAFGSKEYAAKLSKFLGERSTLSARYAKQREMSQVPLTVSGGRLIHLSPGHHSELIRAIVEEFAPRYVPGGQLVYVGDTGSKWGYFDESLLESLGIHVESHGKMPDVVIYFPAKSWLILAEAVTSHGPVDSKRHEELRALFQNAKPGLVFLGAFPDRTTFSRFQEAISWETEVWISEAPTHLIHFNGAKFLGPH